MQSWLIDNLVILNPPRRYAAKLLSAELSFKLQYDRSYTQSQNQIAFWNLPSIGNSCLQYTLRRSPLTPKVKFIVKCYLKVQKLNLYNPHFSCCCFLEEVESCGKVCVWALSTLSPSDWVWFSWLGFCWCHRVLAAACTLHWLLNTSLRQMPSPVFHSPALWSLLSLLSTAHRVSVGIMSRCDQCRPLDTAVVTRALMCVGPAPGQHWLHSPGCPASVVHCGLISGQFWGKPKSKNAFGFTHSCSVHR